MRIVQLTAFQIPVRLRKPVRHASHTRFDNKTLIVRCQLSDGSTGWGEGLPRQYVTGESIESVWRHLQQTDFAQLADAQFATPPEAASILDTFRLAVVEPDPEVSIRECFGNSVRCAIETAVLDAACRSVGCSISEFLRSVPEATGITQARNEVFYSGVVTSVVPAKQWISAWKMRLFGFRQVKVKVGTDGIDDAACLRRLRRIVGPAVDLRLDANEAWHCQQLVQKLQPLMEFQPTSVEQPVPHQEVAGLAELRSELSVPVMLDESLCCHEDAIRAIEGGWCDLFNIRLSKCGGLMNSLRLAILAKQHGIGFQLGCQVGETGILSAAGRHYACSVADIRYLEGSYDRFLVRETLTVEDLTFRRRGRASSLSGPGLGITVNESRVRNIAIRSAELIPAATERNLSG